MKLNWSAWLYGLIGGFVGGGAGAIGAAFGGLMTDPDHFNPSNGPHHILVLMGWTFLFSGAITAAAYLSKSPLPSVEPSTTVSVATTMQEGAPPKTTTTVSATSPIAKP